MDDRNIQIGINRNKAGAEKPAEKCGILSIVERFFKLLHSSIIYLNY
jgi:hypothetical protein